MCSLFGIIDINNKLTIKEKSKYLKVLSAECEERGTDATGFAYIRPNNTMRIFKKPLPAHKVKLGFYDDNPKIIMGHTRLATKGSKKNNNNNHPFYSQKLGFALAHNGILCNDDYLRISKDLPKTNIETDSYIAVQLIEHDGELSFNSLCNMAETVKGTFTFTVLNEKNELYIVKGNSPIHIADMGGWFMYASTYDILFNTLDHFGLTPNSIPCIDDGEILKFRNDGLTEKAKFKFISHYSFLTNYHYSTYTRRNTVDCNFRDYIRTNHHNNEYIKEYVNYLYDFASELGLEGDFIDELWREGCGLTEIEDTLYDYECEEQANFCY